MSTTTGTEHQSSAVSDKLEGQAASAAYHLTRDTSSTGRSSHPLLDENGKLSSAGAATSLRHARAQDLPSFPSQGGVSLASAGAAASLADSNKKSFEYWKPGEIPAANKAALQAKDYEMDPLWRPETSRAGSKAAVLAHRNTKSPDAIYTPFTSSASPSAAGAALSSNSSGPSTNHGVPISDQKKALMAATGAMAGSRRRADSAPTRPQANTSKSDWALRAATSSQKSVTSEFTSGDPGFEAARIQNAKITDRSMYGSTPPVAIEVQEKNRQDVLRASAVAMARKMYSIQQSHIDEARGMKRADNRPARGRAYTDASDSYTSKPSQRYENLEEAARKLAQERLAKIHDEHAEYRQYYGAQTSPPKSRLNLTLRKSRNKPPAMTEDSSDSDEEQSRKIRSQMSIFQSKLAEVDSKKRQADRNALLEAAHKNVTKQMNALDEKVFEKTGKASPQQRELWERQARERAQRDSDERMMNVGRVHIGGGKYLDQSEIDAIARARLQPTLDDITDKAEKQRARDEENRLEQERLKAEAEAEKQRQKEIDQGIKENQRKAKEEERARKAEEKRIQKEEAAAAKNKRLAEAAVEKEKRQAEAATAAEKARLEKEEKRQSKDGKGSRFGGFLGKSGAATAGVAGGATSAVATEADPAGGTEAHAVEGDNDRLDDADPGSPTFAKEANGVAKSPEAPLSPETDRKDDSAVIAPTSPGEVTSPASPKGDSKMKSWFRSRFRSTSKAQNELEDEPGTEEAVGATEEGPDEDKRSDSMRDVAMAGRRDSESEDMYGESKANDVAPISPVKDANDNTAVRDRSSSISSVSSYGEKEEESKPSSPEQVKDLAPESATTPIRTSTDRPPSRSESEGENRGRKGFRQRLLSKVKRDKNKDKNKNIIQEEPTVEQQAAAVPMSPEGGNYEAFDANNTQINDNKDVKLSGERNDDEEEARDTFEEEKLAPPPKLGEAKAGSPSRGSRERSRFTEDL